MSETVYKQGHVTHVWPYNRNMNPDAQPFSDEREDDVVCELRGLTLDHDLVGSVFVALHETNRNVNFHGIAATDFKSKFDEDDYDPNRTVFFEPYAIEQTIHRAATSAEPARTENVQNSVPFNLGSKKHVEALIQKYRNHEISALVLRHPEFNDYGPDRYLKYLPMVRSRCPELPIYIFHWEFRDDKWGVERSGNPNNWESEFPALADVKRETQEIIVENMLVKGNVHVVAGPPEAFKTMGLIELSSAILDERPVFDLLEVKHRYPIMFLCADMSPVQLDEWAAPFNLRKHGGDFRVMRASAGIPKIDDPVLQKAVQGRILILDTMLDFAKIQKAFESGEWNTFMENLRSLMNSHGCVAVIMTAHSTRAEVKSESDTINKAEYFKDSVTFHGKTDIGFGCKVLKGTSQIKWERVKSRGFKYGKFSFTVAVYDDDGNSNLDGGRFPVYTRPEDMKQLAEERKSQGGRKSDPDKQAKIDFLKSTPGSLQARTEAMNAKFHSDHHRATAGKWLEESEFDADKEKI